MGKKKAPAIGELDEAVATALREGHREFLRYVARRTGSLVEAEDVLQDFYQKAIRSARTIKEPGALRGWLAQILRRTLVDHYRRDCVRKSAMERLEREGAPIVRIDADAEQAVCGCLYRILPPLPADYSRIIWQVDLLGQSRRKVAKTLRISENNLGVRIHRARSALRSALQRFCTTCPTHGFLNCACEEDMRSTTVRTPKSRPRERQ